MEINLIFLISVIPAIILFGIAKSGLGGSIALISIPLMTLSMSLTEALAIMLPILIFSDFIAVYRFRKNYDLETLKLIIPVLYLQVIISYLKQIKLNLIKKIILRAQFVQLLQDLHLFVYMLEVHQQVFIYYL